MRESRITVGVIGFVILVLLAFVFVFQVRTTESAVHYRAGKVHRVINANVQDKDESGWHLRLPPPFDKVVKYDQRVRVLDGRLTETQLQDDWQVIISMYAAWRVADPVALQEKLPGDPKESVRLAERVIKEIIENEKSQVIGKRRFEDLVNTNKERLKFDEIAEEITGRVRDALQSEHYGLELVAFGIRRIAIPEDTTQTVFERMKEERRKVAMRYMAAGQREKDTIIAGARAEADRIMAEANAEAIETRRQAEELEADFYDVFAKDPDLAIFLREIESLRTIAAQARESGSPLSFVLNLETEPFTLLRKGAGFKEEE